MINNSILGRCLCTSLQKYTFSWWIMCYSVKENELIKFFFHELTENIFSL